jgi:hypothetical protein
VRFPFLLKLYAGGGYRGSKFHGAAGKALAELSDEIVKRWDPAKGFVVIPNDGLSSGHSPGSEGADGSRRIEKAFLAEHLLSCASLPLNSLCNHE